MTSKMSGFLDYAALFDKKQRRRVGTLFTDAVRRGASDASAVVADVRMQAKYQLELAEFFDGDDASMWTRVLASLESHGDLVRGCAEWALWWGSLSRPAKDKILTRCEPPATDEQITALMRWGHMPTAMPKTRREALRLIEGYETAHRREMYKRGLVAQARAYR